MIEYLNDKRGKDFPYMIDPHKIFVNIQYIPDGTKKEASNFYLSQLMNEIENLKKLCYEMKLNGITRILMPITKNTFYNILKIYQVKKSKTTFLKKSRISYSFKINSIYIIFMLFQ